MNDPGLPKGKLIIQRDLETLRAALRNFEPHELGPLLRWSLVQLFGPNRAEIILENSRSPLND